MTQLHIGRLVTIWLLVISGYGHAAEPLLQAPFPLNPAHTEPSTSQERVACPEPVEPVRDVMGVSFYTDAHHSIVDLRIVNDHKTRLKPLSTFLRVVSQTTDRYLHGGDIKAAHCAFLWLTRWAEVDAMLGRVNRQGSYERKWSLGGVALSYVNIQHAPDLDRKAKQQVERWFQHLAAAVQAEYQQMTCPMTISV